jgi:hypothetical protein
MMHLGTNIFESAVVRPGRPGWWPDPQWLRALVTPTPMPTDSADDRHMLGPKADRRTAEAHPITDDAMGLAKERSETGGL